MNQEFYDMNPFKYDIFNNKMIRNLYFSIMNKLMRR